MRLFVTALLVAPMLAPTDVDARSTPVRCDTIQRGETVFAVARRVTGRADSHRETWFRIVDRTRVIPKSAYNRVQAGWQACIPAERRVRGSGTVSTSRGSGTVSSRTLVETVPDPRQTVPDRQETIPDSQSSTRDWPLTFALMCLGPAAFGAAIGFGWRSVERVVTRRRALSRELQQFADVFVADFEKPLRIADMADSPVRARFRWLPRARRLEILLAPAAGRRYPNLDDHRRNVEYDVERIAHRLRTYPFERRPLRAEGAWVVIPFQFNPGPRTGAPV